MKQSTPSKNTLDRETVLKCIDVNIELLKQQATNPQLKELMANMPKDQIEEMAFVTKMQEIQLRMQDEAFTRTNVEQEELEENLLSYQSDPVVGAKMR